MNTRVLWWFLLGGLMGSALPAFALRRDTLQVFPNGIEVPKLCVTGETAFMGGLTLDSADLVVEDATASVLFRDEDCTDADDNVTLDVACTDTGTGAEDCDLTITQQEAGAAKNVLVADADGGITLGAAGNNSLTITTDSTGDAEVVLPTGAIGTGEILDGDLTAADIANITRTVSIPLNAFIECETNGGAAVTIGASGADALPDIICSNTDGLGCGLQYDDTGGSPDTAEACAQLTVPADYASGGAFVARATKDAETGANTEVLNCQVSVNGAALEAAGTVTLSGTASAAYTCTPTIAALAAGDSLGFTFFITSGGTVDDTVDIQSVAFQYTATQ